MSLRRCPCWQDAELEDEGEAARQAAWDAEAAHEAFQAQRAAAERREAEAQRRYEEALLVRLLSCGLCLLRCSLLLWA